MTFHTAEFQTEFDAYRAWAATVVEPQSEADLDQEWAMLNGPEDSRYAGLAVEEIIEAVSEEWREAAEWERDQAALHAWCDSNR